jgi:hypothetical protein
VDHVIERQRLRVAVLGLKPIGFIVLADQQHTVFAVVAIEIALYTHEITS